MRQRVIIAAILLVMLIMLPWIPIETRDASDMKAYEEWEMQCINEYKESGEYYIFVDVPQYKLYLYKGDELVKEYKISTGTYDTPSPVGVWKIISKADWGEGFGGRWLGFNVPWGKYGIHGTLNPGSIGWNSSQGCIRMFNKDVKELSSIVKHGTPVEIYGGALGPFSSSLRLLTPGDRGADVMEVQKRLQKLGYFNGNPDGVYGAATEAAVVKFQKDNKLKVDKKIGKTMYELLGIVAFE
ncbi:MAG: L,D-transpeptidase family protein [Caulobacteraceae bacterium]